MRAICCLLLLTGCDALFQDTDIVTWTPDRPTDTDVDTVIDTGTTTGCPADTAEASSADVSVRIAVVDGSQLSLIVGTSAYEDVPPVCVSSDGTQVQVLLLSGAEPYAWLRSQADGPTNEVLDADAGVEVEFFGADSPVTFGEGDWYEGNWVVSQEGTVWTHVVSGSARDGAQSAALFVEVEVTP